MPEQTKPAPNSSLQRKHLARVAAVQCIYACMIDPLASGRQLIEWQLEQSGSDAWLPMKPDKKLLQGIVLGVEESMNALEQQLSNLLGERWTGKRMPTLMRAVFLAALYELIYTPKLHPTIIIDQYVGVSDAFLDESDISFVNGALQEIIRSLRQTTPVA